MNLVIFISVYVSTFCTGWSQSVTEGIRVHQTPSYLTVPEGGRANLTCNFSADNILDFTINWLHRSEKSTNQTYVIYMNNTSKNLSTKMETTKEQSIIRSELSINNLQQEDSGTYYCELMTLNPPSTEGVLGNGSRLIVTGSDFPTNKRQYLYLLMGVLLLVIFLLVARRWNAKQIQAIVHGDSVPATTQEEISGPEKSTYATLSSATVTEASYSAELEVVYSYPVIKNTTHTSAETAEYAALKICEGPPKAQSGDEDVSPVVYSQMLRKEKI
ncbi:uncharacterized protein [Hemitrygon akajei]|uniref:uncharacterized protein n=1 Tax=Hemitrygon akajei TaxID=2704970 RepID=UPI003BFA3131